MDQLFLYVISISEMRKGQETTVMGWNKFNIFSCLFISTEGEINSSLLSPNCTSFHGLHTNRSKAATNFRSPGKSPSC